MQLRKTSGVVVLVVASLGRFLGVALAEDAYQTDVAKWYAEDRSRLPKCKVDPNIEKSYPDIDATLAALKYALANDKAWAGVTWKQQEDLAAVRKGEIEALDDPNMMFGWKPDQKPLKEIKKGGGFNDAVTKNATLIEFHVHTFLTGNDQDAVGPRPAAEVMRTLSHELAHVWDERAHRITLYSADLGRKGLPYDFQKLVPAEPFSKDAIHELNRVLGKPEPVNADANDKDPDVNEEENPNKFYIYAINTSGWSLYVARPGEVVKLVAGRGLADSGLGGGKVESKKLHNQGFMSKEDAVAHLKEKVKLGHTSVWTGQFVKYNGEEYRSVHMPEVVPTK